MKVNVHTVERLTSVKMQKVNWSVRCVIRSILQLWLTQKKTNIGHEDLQEYTIAIELNILVNNLVSFLTNNSMDNSANINFS